MESLHTKTLVHLLSRPLDVIQDHVRSAEVEIEEMIASISWTFDLK